MKSGLTASPIMVSPVSSRFSDFRPALHRQNAYRKFVIPKSFIFWHIREWEREALAHVPMTTPSSSELLLLKLADSHKVSFNDMLIDFAV